MLYKQKSFTVPKGSRDPKDCSHGWTHNGHCIFCGEQLVVIKTEEPPAKPELDDDATGKH
jgi:hypothetical protein